MVLVKAHVRLGTLSSSVYFGKMAAMFSEGINFGYSKEETAFKIGDQVQACIPWQNLKKIDSLAILLINSHYLK